MFIYNKLLLIFFIAVLLGCNKNSDNCPATGTTVVSSNYNIVYEGRTLTLGTGSSAGNTYSWTGPGGWTSTQPSPSRNNMQPQDAGNYSVKIYDLKNCNVFNGSKNIQVTPPPVAPCTPFNNTITSSYAPIGNFNFPTGASSYAYQASYYYTVVAVNNERIDIQFSGTQRPEPGLYKTVFNLSTPDDFVYFVINSGVRQFRSKGADEVYVNNVGGKMIVTFCNVTMYEWNNPSFEFILTGKVSPF
jgi:hypothetical protein